jgi:hypothetical protein
VVEVVDGIQKRVKVVALVAEVEKIMVQLEDLVIRLLLLLLKETTVELLTLEVLKVVVVAVAHQLLELVVPEVKQAVQVVMDLQAQLMHHLSQEVVVAVEEQMVQILDLVDLVEVEMLELLRVELTDKTELLIPEAVVEQEDL